MSLYTGKILHIYEWTDLYIDKNVIEQVKKLSSDEKVLLVKEKYTMFEWVLDIPISEDTQ